MARDIIADRSPALAWEGAMARILVAVFGFCLLALGASPAAHAAKRVAFVVGIDFLRQSSRTAAVEKGGQRCPGT